MSKKLKDEIKKADPKIGLFVMQETDISVCDGG